MQTFCLIFITEPSRGVNSTSYFNERKTLFLAETFSYFQVQSAPLVLLSTSGSLAHEPLEEPCCRDCASILQQQCLDPTTQKTSSCLIFPAEGGKISFQPGMISGVLAKLCQTLWPNSLKCGNHGLMPLLCNFSANYLILST